MVEYHDIKSFLTHVHISTHTRAKMPKVIEIEIDSKSTNKREMSVSVRTFKIEIKQYTFKHMCEWFIAITFVTNIY